jgi:hypothetical protein
MTRGDCQRLRSCQYTTTYCKRLSTRSVGIFSRSLFLSPPPRPAPPPSLLYLRRPTQCHSGGSPTDHDVDQRDSTAPLNCGSCRKTLSSGRGVTVDPHSGSRVLRSARVRGGRGGRHGGALQLTADGAVSSEKRSQRVRKSGGNGVEGARVRVKVLSHVHTSFQIISRSLKV